MSGDMAMKSAATSAWYFTDIADAVDAPDKRDDAKTEQGGEKAGGKVGGPDQGKQSRGDIVEERPVITGIILPGSFGQEIIAEPGMDRLVMVEQLEVELPEAKEECKDENEDENPFKSKK